MATFDPRRVLRQVSNTLLKQFFEKRRVQLDVNWAKLKETAIAPVFDALQTLDDEKRTQIEAALHDIHDMATEQGIKVLVANGDTWGKDLRPELDAHVGRYDKAMWAYLHHHDVWSLAVRFALADHLMRSSSWTTRVGVDKKDHFLTKAGKLDTAVLDRLEGALCAFYKRSEGRGHACRVEHEIRKPNQHYFFISLSDYTDTYDKLDPTKKQFIREAEQRAFQIVIVYDPVAGQLDVCAKGGKKVIAALQDIFGQEVLGVRLPPDDQKPPPYDLNIVMDPAFDFPVDPSSPIRSVALRRVCLAIKNTKRRIQLEADPDRGPRDIQQMINQYIRAESLPRSLLDPVRIALFFEMKHDGDGKPVTFTSNLSSRNCDLKGKRSEQKCAAEACLTAWGVRRG